MKSLTIRVVPESTSLLVGGRSAPRSGGHKATARDGDGRPVIPASALRGALRLELERLLAGEASAGDGGAPCTPHDQDPEVTECDCPVCRLFGREAGSTGTLRLEDARLEETQPRTDDEAPATLLRPRVGVSRRTGSAVAQHLVFAEATDRLDDHQVFHARAWLLPRNHDDGPEELGQDLSRLRAAATALRTLGGGKAQGLGWVRCVVDELDVEEPEPSPDSGAGTTDGHPTALDVTFIALAPLHLGAGRPLGNFHATRQEAPGSTVRGALCWALLHQGRVEAEDPRFQHLVERARFGTARPRGHVPCATRRRCRPVGHVFDDLVLEVVRRQAARVGVALPFAGPSCPQDHRDRPCPAVKTLPWPYREGAPEPVTRIHTRTALNRRTGTAMDEKLFSLELLEPPLELTARLSGLDAATARLLLELDGGEAWLGGKRSQGLGHCRLRVTPAREAGDAPGKAEIRRAREGCEELDRELRAAWQPEWGELLAEHEAPVALVLTEPWLPGEEEARLTDRLLAQERRAIEAGPLAGHRPLAGFVLAAEEGGFGALEARRWGAGDGVPRGERPPRPVAAPGSVWVYAVPRGDLETQLAGWLRRGRRGGGARQQLGWGRFELRGAQDFTSRPSFTTTTEETPMSTTIQADPSADPAAVGAHKAWLVERGNALGQEAREIRNWNSQIRILQDSARQEAEPEVLLNLLRYQRAREATAWKKSKNAAETLGNSLEQDLQSCIAKAGEDRELAMELIRHLLLYTARAYQWEHQQFKAEKKDDGNNGQAGGGS